MKSLAEIGRQLRGSGLTSRTLAWWAGTERLSALPPLLPALAAQPPATHVATTLAVFVAGADVPSHGFSDRALDEHGLLNVGPRTTRAHVAILPVVDAMVVCDRLDAEADEQLVCWPDDSSYHLATAIPKRRFDHWLDLGCGSGFAQLARPELGTYRVAIDRNERAVAHARLGFALSGSARYEVIVGDLATELPKRVELVTCNAPIPGGVPGGSGGNDVPIWRRADRGFFDRLWASIPARLVESPDALAVVHCVRDAIPDDLPGERVIVTYTPADFTPTFAVLWWRPFAPARVAIGHRLLTPERPHVDARDRDDVLAATSV